MKLHFCLLETLRFPEIKMCKTTEELRLVIKDSIIQGESLARGPKLLSIKNYVFEIMT